jgi:hypothetical protein
MATRSRIAVKQQDGTIDSIYCHFDGYPSGVGDILINYYSRKEADQLMQGGDISTLGDDPEHCKKYQDAGRKYLNLNCFFENLGDRGEEYGYVLKEDDQWYCIPVVGDGVGELQLVTKVLSESGGIS